MSTDKSQSDKFKDAARELKADEDEAHWEKRLRRIAKKKAGSAGNDAPRPRNERD